VHGNYGSEMASVQRFGKWPPVSPRFASGARRSIRIWDTSVALASGRRLLPLGLHRAAR